MTQPAWLPSLPLIDVNVHVSRWPFRRLPHDRPQRLVERLRANRVRQAWACSFDAVLHSDLGAVNRRLVATCQQFDGGLLRPIGAVNLALPNWESDVDFCAAEPDILGVRLYPGIHPYSLVDGKFAELCARCAAAGLILQIVVRLEDPRTEHPRFASTTIEMDSVAEIIQQHAALKVILLNPGRDLSPAVAGRLAAVPNLFFDLGMMEQTGGVELYLKQVSVDRLLFGSHFPYHYHEAAVLKLCENPLGQYATEAIAYRNAEKLLSDHA